MPLPPFASRKRERKEYAAGILSTRPAFGGIGGIGVADRVWRVLVFYSDYGDGHRHAAEAIAEAIRAREASVEVAVLDFMRETHPFLHPLMRRSFINTLKYFPDMYRFAYQRTRAQSDAPLLDWFTSMGERRMLQYIAQTMPDVVVSAHPFAAQGMAYLRREGWLAVPAITVITDHSDHRYWLAEGTSLYLVGSEMVRARLVAHGVPETDVVVTGIPVSLKFMQAPSSQEARRALEIPPERKVVLVMGGGLGMIDNAIQLLKALGALDVEVLFITGRNVRLRKEAEKMTARKRLRARIYGYVEEMERFMAAADVIITKPGGLTTTEALALGLPLVLYSPLPGQEEDNAAYLISHGAAVWADSAQEAASWVRTLIEAPEKLSSLRRCAAALGRPDAAWQAAGIILETMRTPRPAHEGPRAAFRSAIRRTSTRALPAPRAEGPSLDHWPSDWIWADGT